MKKRYILLFCLLLWNFSFSQIDSSVTLSPRSFRACWKIAPLAFFTPQIGPSFRTGVEYRIKNNLSFYNEVGFFFMESEGMLGTLELKCYPGKEKSLGGFYFSGEVFFKTQNFSFRDKFDDVNLRYNLNKNVLAFTVKIGMVEVARKGFIFESFGGLGIRYSMNSNTLTRIQNNQFTKELNSNLIGKKDGDRVYLNFELGFRIGARLAKKGRYTG